jgi:cyclopropane-fatty-acyl-phospholipid synthase
VTGCTHSKSEAEEARVLCDPSKVSIILCDYTKVQGNFDRVVCIQMLEHLGGKYSTFFSTVSSYLKEDGGRFLLQVSVLRSPPPPLRSDPLTRKYLLSNAVTPTQEEVVKGICSTKGFTIQSIEGLGKDLLKTWEEYGRNLETAFDSGTLLDIEEKYKKLFVLVSTAVRLVVKTGKLSMWQILVTKDNNSIENFNSK